MAEAEKKKIELDPDPGSVLGATQEYADAWNKKYGEKHREEVLQRARDAEEAARMQREANAPAEAADGADAKGEGK